MTRSILVSATFLLCAASALADVAEHACLTDPGRTVFTLPGGEVGPQDRNVNGAPDQTVSGVGESSTLITVPSEDTWGLRVRNPGGQVGTAALPTCIVGVHVDGQCGPSVTWEECKANFDKGGIHIPNQPPGGGDAEVHNVLVREMEDGVLTPRAGGLHADGSDLHFSCEDCVLVRIRDDAFEADGCPSVTLTDSYLNGFTGFSYRPTSGQHRITNAPVITIQGTVLIDLICQAGEAIEGHPCQTAGQTIGRLWKRPGSLSSCTPEPRLVVDGNLLVRLEDGDPANMTWPQDVTINGTATVYWEGPGAFPGYPVLPGGVTVVEHDDAAFRWALTRFRLARGCTSDFSSCTWEAAAVPSLAGWSRVVMACALLLAARLRVFRHTTDRERNLEDEEPMPKFSEIPWIAEHIELYRTDPEKAHLWDSTPVGGPGVLPTLLLTTTGRKSGEPRALPLIYGEAGDSYVVIASKGGMPTHPVWYLNLEANPGCQLMVGTRRVSARARVAEGAERERLWAQMRKIYPPYDEYQERAGARTIPVVVLDPVR